MVFFYYQALLQCLVITFITKDFCNFLLSSMSVKTHNNMNKNEKSFLPIFITESIVMQAMQV